MPSLSVVLRSLVAERRFLELYNAEVFLNASISIVQEPEHCLLAVRSEDAVASLP
jgi:hypothetical protein